MVTRSGDSKIDWNLLLPILMGYAFAFPVGDRVIRMFGVDTSGGFSPFLIFICAASGGVIGIATAIVMRLWRKRVADPPENN
jgi:hypothetical protein